MSAANDGGPAFPVQDTHHHDGQVQYGINGMSLRDWFAGQALAGLMSEYSTTEITVDLATIAYDTADAMLRAKVRRAG